MALGSISDIYSQDTYNAKKQLEEIEKNKVGPYESKYQDTIDGLMDKILNRKEFSYDFNADPLYQQYKDQYTVNGKNAMLDTVAAASGLTGGYGNSYAATAGSQAYQQYLTQLNDRIPELYNAAMNKYQMDTDNLYNQFSAVGTQEDREYGKYRDDVSDWQLDRDYYYGKFSDSVSNDKYVSDYNQSESQFNQTMDYNKSRDAVSDSQWQQEFNYQKEKDARDYALSLARASSGSGSSSSGSKSSSSNTKSVAVSPMTTATNALTGGNTRTLQRKATNNTTLQTKMASAIAKGGGGTKKAKQYLVDEANKGNITLEQASSILSGLKR